MDVYSELIRAQAENLSADPAVGTKGRIYHKSTTEPLKVDDGTTIHKVLTDQMDISAHVTSVPMSKTNLAVAILSDVKAFGVAGGASSTGSWITRTLNTEVDPDGIVTLASNKFTLAAGTYLIRGSAPAYASGGHKAKIYNVTDSTDAILGTSERCASGTTVSNRSFISGVVTIAASKEFSVQHLLSSADTSGLGYPSFTGDEVYTVVEIMRIK